MIWNSRHFLVEITKRKFAQLVDGEKLLKTLPSTLRRNKMLKPLKEFIKGFKSYPPTWYDIGQLAAENLIWAVTMTIVGGLLYLLLKVL